MKIAICTPYYGDVTAHYAYCLGQMLLLTSKANIVFNGLPAAPELNIFMRSSSVLPRIRSQLVDDALAWGANYLLWIDGDHWFPAESLVKLLSLNLPVAGVNYPTRETPALPTATDFNGQRVWTTENLAKERLVTQVQTLGLGLCLIDMNVIKALKAQQPERPLFAMEPGPNGSFIGEDIVFFRRVNEAGFKVYLDHALSWEIGHVARHVLYNSDTIAQMSG